MKLIIDIPEEMHEKIMNGYVPLGISKHLKNGIPLEQRTGHWIDDEFGTKCSCCNKHTHLDKFDRPMRLLYCSFCGAKMERKS